ISNREGKFHIYRQEVGKGTPELIDTGTIEPNILRLSPDRQCILFSSDTPVAQQAKAEAEGEMGRGDGEKNAGHRQSGGVFWVMRGALGGGGAGKVVEWPKINNFQCARAPSTECVFSSFTNEALEFYEFDAEKGKTNLIFKISDPEWALYNWTLSPNGELLALAKKLRGQEEAELQIMSL